MALSNWWFVSNLLLVVLMGLGQSTRKRNGLFFLESREQLRLIVYRCFANVYENNHKQKDFIKKVSISEKF